MAMARLSSLSILLFGAASAQHVCKDDANFLPDNPFMTGWGPDGDRTCGDWKNTHFSEPSTSYDTCISEIGFELVGIPGEQKMSKAELLSYMSKPRISRDGAGCCGNSTEGSPCDMFMEMLPQPPCDASWQEDDGKCIPCYGIMRDGECQQCWALDTRACDEDACSQIGGEWSPESPERKCRLCMQKMIHECPQDKCEEFGGTWDRFDERCAGCQLEHPLLMDVSGCDKATCEGAGHGFRTWEHCEDGECFERSNCARCAPQFNDHWGCNEARCNEFENARWDQFEERCHLCAPESNRVEGCNGDQQQCEDNGGRYRKWDTDCDEHGACAERSYCYGCFPWDGQYSGCDEDRCNEASANDPSIVWVCNDDHSWQDGRPCECKKCRPDEVWGCGDKERCENVGGTWCHNSHCTDNCDDGGSACSHENWWNCHDEASCHSVDRTWCHSSRCTDQCDDGGHGGRQCATVTVPRSVLNFVEDRGFRPLYC